MAARDRFEYELKCADCGTSGVAEASEDDHPYMRSLGYMVDSVPPGFSVKDENENKRGTKFVCDTCGAVVKKL